MDDNTTLIAFKAISKFVKDLADEFGKRYHGLELYNHLIQKTTIAHEGPVAKHVDAFHRYCVANREGIVEKDILGHPSDVDEVVYSDKVRFNVREILGVSDEENKDIIHRHLLTISAIVDAGSNAKQVLRNMMLASSAPVIPAAVSVGESSGNKMGLPIPTDSNEGKFLNDLISTVEKSVNPEAEANPMQAVQSVLQSGVFTEMLGKMQSGLSNGEIDLGRLMGTMTGLLGTMGGGSDMMTNMMGMMMGGMGGMGGMNFPAMPPKSS